MNKKKLSIILSAVIILQLAFPIGSVIYSKSFENNFNEKGEVFKMRLTSVYYYSYDTEAFLSPSIKLYDDYKGSYSSNGYVEVIKGEDGFARYRFSEKKPKTSSYIVTYTGVDYIDFPETLIEVKHREDLGEAVFMTDHDGIEVIPEGIVNVGAKEIYLEAKIYKGKILPIAVYVDSMNIEDTLSLLSEYVAQTGK